jgi:AcrR family transcriptional regulator
VTFTWSPPNVTDKNTDATRDVLLQMAAIELREQGLLGFRIARVAESAHCSVSLIYRYFVDREGLIVQVLADVFDKLQVEYVNSVAAWVNSQETITASTIATTVPNISAAAESEFTVWRLRILAISTENTFLRRSLEATVQRVLPVWREIFATMASKLPAGETIDFRVFGSMLAMHMPYYNALLGADCVQDAEYREFLTDVLSRNGHSSAATAPRR